MLKVKVLSIRTKRVCKCDHDLNGKRGICVADGARFPVSQWVMAELCAEARAGLLDLSAN